MERFHPTDWTSVPIIDQENDLPIYNPTQRVEIIKALIKARQDFPYSINNTLNMSHSSFYEIVNRYGFKPSGAGVTKAIEGKTEVRAKELREAHAHDEIEDANIAYEDFKKVWITHFVGVAVSTVFFAGTVIASVFLTWWLGLIVTLVGSTVFAAAAATVVQRYFSVHGQDHKKRIRRANRNLRDILTEEELK